VTKELFILTNVQLNNGKEWLFVAPKLETITINCKLLSNPLHFNIVGTGKLTLDNTCLGYTNHFILTPQGSLLSNEIKIDYVPNININDSCCENIKIIKELNLTVNENYKKLSIDNLDNASHKLDEIIMLADNITSNNDKSNEPKIFNQNNFYNFSLIFSIILIVIFIFYLKTIYGIFKKRFCKTRNIVLRARDIVQNIDTNFNASAPEAEQEININEVKKFLNRN